VPVETWRYDKHNHASIPAGPRGRCFLHSRNSQEETRGADLYPHPQTRLADVVALVFVDRLCNQFPIGTTKRPNTLRAFEGKSQQFSHRPRAQRAMARLFRAKSRSNYCSYAESRDEDIRRVDHRGGRSNGPLETSVRRQAACIPLNLRSFLGLRQIELSLVRPQDLTCGGSMFTGCAQTILHCVLQGYVNIE
jgi:hypothetical protein